MARLFAILTVVLLGLACYPTQQPTTQAPAPTQAPAQSDQVAALIEQNKALQTQVAQRPTQVQTPQAQPPVVQSTVVPAPPPTQTRVPVQPVAPTVSSGKTEYILGCSGPTKDVGQVKQFLGGLDIVCLGTEYDAYTWRSVPIVVNVTIPDGWIATLHLENNDIVVTQTPGQYRIMAGTFRRKSGYPASDAVHNPCALLAKEQEFGRNQIPQFPVKAYGFDCPGAVSVTASLHVSVAGQPTVANQSANSGVSPVQPPVVAQIETEPVLTVEEVAVWCKPDCSGALIRLTDKDGKEIPNAVKMRGNVGCYEVEIPQGISYDGWTGVSGLSGQSPTKLRRVCEGTFYKR